MLRHKRYYFSYAKQELRAFFDGPQSLAFVSAALLGAYWWGGEATLIGFAIGVPALALWLCPNGAPRAGIARDARTGLVARAAFEELSDSYWDQARDNGKKTVMMALALDNLDQLVAQHGQQAADKLVDRVSLRIVDALRDTDIAAMTDTGQFNICMAVQSRIHLEVAIQTAGRLQAAVEEPVAMDGTTLYTTCSVGFCLNGRSPAANGTAWRNAAQMALQDAQRHGTATIRAYSNDVQSASDKRHALRDEAAEALENGQIQPWFQPQISTDTGRVTGFEALARWIHPTRGTVAPADFLPALAEANLMERLSEVITFHSFGALKAWDAAGLHIPRVGVNFSAAELRNPRFVDKMRWELDRFDLTPERIAIEILETVVTHAPDDMVVRTINGLYDLGCHIDLDDFGTGNASISAMRRFNVNRIKIDRCFVMKSDRDPEQQRMVSAILTIAERLNVQTLAEGVETAGEHALLAQLGCDHVQGFGISKPLPFEQTIHWMRAHEAKLAYTPKIGGREAG